MFPRLTWVQSPQAEATSAVLGHAYTHFSPIFLPSIFNDKPQLPADTFIHQPQSCRGWRKDVTKCAAQPCHMLQHCCPSTREVPGAELQLCQPREVTPNSRHIASGRDICDRFENYELEQLFKSRTHTPAEATETQLRNF